MEGLIGTTTSQEVSVRQPPIAGDDEKPDFDRRQPRVCSNCERHEGTPRADGGRLVVNREWVVEEPGTGQPIRAHLCQECGVRMNGRVLGIVRAGTAEANENLARATAKWEQRQAERAKRAAVERTTIEAEIMSVVAGTAKAPFVSCEEKDGEWRCIRPGCSCQKALKGRPKPIRHLAVVGGEILRVCCAVAQVIWDLQTKGVREVCLRRFALPGDEDAAQRMTPEQAATKCRKHLGWLKFLAREDRANQDGVREREAAMTPSRPQFIAGPRVMVDPRGLASTKASHKAKERQRALAEALRRGEGLETVCPIREHGSEVGEDWSVVLQHNQAMDAHTVARRLKKNQGQGDKGKGKGGRK
jgi:hypothetical protein